MLISQQVTLHPPPPSPAGSRCMYTRRDYTMKYNPTTLQSIQSEVFSQSCTTKGSKHMPIRKNRSKEGFAAAGPIEDNRLYGVGVRTPTTTSPAPTHSYPDTWATKIFCGRTKNVGSTDWQQAVSVARKTLYCSCQGSAYNIRPLPRRSARPQVP